ncbi:MAG TPA: SIS domain-containing protein [Candidatus Angelobacter sp.]|nr:SIS domain-containing protein [Candidatus Angelobacter sp.]
MSVGHERCEWEHHHDENLLIRRYFHDLSALIPQLPYAAINRIVSVFLSAFAEQRTVYVFGNGGSAASASHMMCDINKGAGGLGVGTRPRVMALTDNASLISAWANDLGYERIFSEQLKTFIKPRDVAFAISTSGDSPNVLLALETAREYGAVTVGLGGCQGGQMKSLCDVCAIIPSDNVQLVEDLHHSVIHAIFVAVRESLLTGATKNLMAGAASF